MPKAAFSSGDFFMDNHENFDDLGGAYYFADDEKSFRARTPKNKGCGCISAAIFIFVIFVLIGTYIFF